MNSVDAEILRTLLLFFLLTIFLVSAFYLRRRKMSIWTYAFWGAFALLLPAFGPFFIIAYRPGKPGRPVWGCNKWKISQQSRKSNLPK